MQTKTFGRIGLLVLLLWAMWGRLSAQEADSSGAVLQVSGSVTATNNGFSLVPTFTLGDPALIGIVSVQGRGRLSFEPQFRFALEGLKPWSIIFIWRYRLVEGARFGLKVGTHVPALNFINWHGTRDGEEEEVIQARRFFPVLELLPEYRFGEGFALSMYYAYARGREKSVDKDHHFLSLRPVFRKFPLSKGWELAFSPEIYYLRIADIDGFYTAGSLRLSREGFPLSLAFMYNRSISTRIADTDYEWSLNLTYTFERSYRAH